VTELNQTLGQVRNDALRPSVQLWWHTFEKWSYLSDPQRVPLDFFAKEPGQEERWKRVKAHLDKGIVSIEREKNYPNKS
jgi:hypothetical protein